jgi:hypothetical protein
MERGAVDIAEFFTIDDKKRAIGAGSYGCVMFGTCKKDGRQVAIKRFDQSLTHWEALSK